MGMHLPCSKECNIRCPCQGEMEPRPSSSDNEIVFVGMYPKHQHHLGDKQVSDSTFSSMDALSTCLRQVRATLVTI